jgi:hypothetical protein
MARNDTYKELNIVTGMLRRDEENPSIANNDTNTFTDALRRQIKLETKSYRSSILPSKVSDRKADDSVIEEPSLLPSIILEGLESHLTGAETNTIGLSELPDEDDISLRALDFEIDGNSKEHFEYLSFVDRAIDSAMADDHLSASQLAAHAIAIESIYGLNRGNKFSINGVVSYGDDFSGIRHLLTAGFTGKDPYNSSFVPDELPHLQSINNDAHGPRANVQALEAITANALRINRIRFTIESDDLDAVKAEYTVLTQELYAGGKGLFTMRENPHRPVYEKLHSGLRDRSLELRRARGLIQPMQPLRPGSQEVRVYFSHSTPLPFPEDERTDPNVQPNYTTRALESTIGPLAK